MSLALPAFTITLIQAIDEHFSQFQTQQLVLTDWLTQNDTGLILYFYPKDNTAGCGVQAEDFSRLKADFAKLGFVVIGVSRDSLKSHQKFINNKHINFALISDPEQQLCEHFGVIDEKHMYGKKVLGVVRSSFVFDKQGKLQQEYRNIRAKNHAETLLTMLADHL